MTDRIDHPELDPIAERLQAERPIPRAGFRAELRRRLLFELERGRPAPRRLRLLLAAYAGSGALLLVVAAVSVAGAGPLAA